ncbi:MAG: cell wall-binding repeat-containing protein [Acidimicrobiaceae bacterium]|nr:cell wall-binding repeat-containing protein [Acidimicrobiaceae bacterium]
MTTYSKRRGRRSLAAIAAAMLMASVLAVVAGSPAQAANTAGEYLVDHDDNASTAMVREFAGRDRYDTAVLLAKRFAGDRGGVGTVANAFVASGESLVDAVSVSGLAGYLDAPVLLTPGDMLHGGVADFIEDYGVGNIHVLGGTVAVSDAVVSALEGLANTPRVTRIAGADRYATSAAIAEQLEGESWCGTNANSAILASGANDRLFDAIAIGPVANRLELPVLLTSGDEVADAVLDYIDDHDVEHVQIVGGTDAVSAAVEQALASAGVDTVKRTAGDSPAELSVAIAKLGSNGCGDDLSPVSNNAVALINSDNMIDGITAAPVLADDADQLGGGLIPILAVGDTLPASVRDYLAGTSAEDASGNKIHMRVLAVGGTAAVSDAVMMAAVDAAASADALTVSIGTINLGDDDVVGGDDDDNADAPDLGPDGRTPSLVIGRSALRLNFSDDIDQATAANLRNKIEDILLINGVPADVEAQGTAATSCKPDGVTVVLESRTLEAGDVISIAQGSVLVGAGGDRRTVQPTSVTVPAAVRDTQRPSMRILAFIGHDEVYGLVSDNKGLTAAANTLLDVTVANRLNNADGDANFEVTSPTARKGILADTDPVGIVVTEPAFASGAMSATLTFDLDDGTTIASGDRFRANRGAVKDTASPRANESQVTTASAIRPVQKLSVSSVLLSDLQHGTAAQQAKAVIPSADEDGDADTAGTLANPAVWLRAKADGDAAGAYGNDWSIRADRASNWNPAKPVDIDVFVSTKDHRIVVRIVNGEPRFADLKAALEANSTVNGLFDVIVDNAPTVVDGDIDSCRPANLKLRVGDLPESGAEADDDGDDRTKLTGGASTGNIAVNFNGWVEVISNEQSGRLLTHLLADTLKRAQRAETANANGSANQTVLLADLGLATTSFAKVAILGPRQTFTVQFTTDESATLPAHRDLAIIPDGFQKCTQANLDADPVAGGCRTKGAAFDTDTATAGVQRGEATPVASIANGYGGNHATASDTDDLNYGSRPRLTRSSSVAAPKTLVPPAG